jgi:2-methylcitrate dehydratase PrpD
VNGAAGDALDFSDNVRAMNGHATATVFPAALAAAEACNSTGDDLLRAFVVGVEAACRVGRLVGEGILTTGFHPTAVIGPFGAAAAAGHLLKLDDAQLRMAFAIAGSLAGGLAASVGTMCKPLHAGTAAANGLLAARLAHRGFTASENVLESPGGFLASHTSAANSEALEQCRGRFFTREILMKQHAVCQLAHGSIDNMLLLRGSAAFTIDDIEEIRLALAASSARICDIAEPRSGLEAKFSVRTLAAMALLGLPTDDPAAFGEAPVEAKNVIELRRRVCVDARKDLPVGLSLASIRLRNGRVFEARNDEAKIDSDLEKRRELSHAKFTALMRPHVQAETISVMKSLVLTIDESSLIREWLTEFNDMPSPP